MAAGAERLSMPPPPADLFVKAVADTVRANVDFVPPLGKGSLYLRPLLMGSGPILGLGPAPSYTFAVYCAAVGAYFKVRGGQAGEQQQQEVATTAAAPAAATTSAMMLGWGCC
jgi:branched-chain amino acid aminotransferase